MPRSAYAWLVLAALSLHAAWARAEATDQPGNARGARPGPAESAARRKQLGKGTRSGKRLHANRKRRKPKDEFSIATSSAVRFGTAHGLGNRRFDAATSETRLRLVPRLRQPWFVLRAPLAFRHRYFWGEPLPETRASAELGVELKSWEHVRPFTSASVGVVHRPTWPDLYQPLPDGGYVHTERHGFWERHGEVGSEFELVPGGELEASYAYTLRLYAHDPAFDPVARPNHLTPGDRDEHRISLRFRQRFEGVRTYARASAFSRSYFFVFARDAGSGRTHAAPGGTPANPLWHLIGLEPEMGATLPLTDWATLDPSYGVSWVDDTFAGYSSYLEHRARLELLFQVAPRWEFTVSGKAELRRYGPGSYAAGPGHPTLKFGDRLEDQRLTASVGARYRWLRGLALTFDGEIVDRHTNFPDYVPGVFPSGQLYDIRWSYQNHRVLFGASYAL